MRRSSFSKGKKGKGKSKTVNRKSASKMIDISVASSSTQKSSTQPKKDTIRLNKYIANSGVCSRREADMYIQTGSVKVNGSVITEMGYQVSKTDEVRFDGRLISPVQKEYILLNKPKGFHMHAKSNPEKHISTLVMSASKSELKPVGRLDKDTVGLILFTNDEELRVKLLDHLQPVRKLYHVQLNRNLTLEDLERISKGVTLQDGFIKIDSIAYVEGASRREIGIELQSSKNGIISKIFGAFGYEISMLDRVIYAGLTKKNLSRGNWRVLSKQEIINLKNS